MLTATVTIATSLLISSIYGDIWFFWKLRFKNEANRQRWMRVLDRFTLSLSDQQLITGTAILIIGYIKLPYAISLYHFSLITNLAMFSCSAHLASVLSLRRYFQRNPQVAWLRVFLMVAFAILLSVSLCIFGAHWGTRNDSTGEVTVILRRPAICIQGIQGQTTQLTLRRGLGGILAIYLAICYWAAFSYVFPNAEVFFTKWLLTKPLEAIERCFSRHDIHERFMHWRPCFPALSLSHILQILWWIASLALSASLRVWGFDESRAGRLEGSENDWSAGQILSLLLIFLPVLSAVEIYFGGSSAHCKRYCTNTLAEEENENTAQRSLQVL